VYKISYLFRVVTCMCFHDCTVLGCQISAHVLTGCKKVLLAGVPCSFCIMCPENWELSYLLAATSITTRFIAALWSIAEVELDLTLLEADADGEKNDGKDKSDEEKVSCLLPAAELL
jgi:hypothetical protein